MRTDLCAEILELNHVPILDPQLAQRLAVLGEELLVEGGEALPVDTELLVIRHVSTPTQVQ